MVKLKSPQWNGHISKRSLAWMRSKSRRRPLALTTWIYCRNGETDHRNEIKQKSKKHLNHIKIIIIEYLRISFRPYPFVLLIEFCDEKLSLASIVANHSLSSLVLNGTKSCKIHQYHQAVHSFLCKFRVTLTSSIHHYFLPPTHKHFSHKFMSWLD